jgi:peptidoglycan-associated lipoprotein
MPGDWIKQSALRSACVLAGLSACMPACVIAFTLLGGCASESQTTSGSQEIAKPVPPPPPPAPEPPPPPKQEEMVAQAAAPPEDPLAWAAGLSDAHFDYNQAKLRKEDKAALDALAQKLKEDSKRKVLVEGHCDGRGTANYNMMLGERRAKSAKQYLVKAGVPGSQIEIVSYGKEKQLCMEMTDECWQSNRRVHFQPQ